MEIITIRLVCYRMKKHITPYTCNKCVKATNGMRNVCMHDLCNLFSISFSFFNYTVPNTNSSSRVRNMRANEAKMALVYTCIYIYIHIHR